MDVINLASVRPVATKDGSEIRELLAHRNSAIVKQSLAEARLAPAASTAPHYHRVTEEIYYITHGSGEMRIGEETRIVQPGDDCHSAGRSPHDSQYRTGNAAISLLLRARLRARRHGAP
jgi:mannose-6-phosphate isomerase-like protein (cupin superfamily)